MNNTYLLGNIYYMVFKNKIIEVKLWCVKNYLDTDGDEAYLYSFRTMDKVEVSYSNKKEYRNFEVNDPEEGDIYKTPEELKEKMLAKAQDRINNF